MTKYRIVKSTYPSGEIKFFIQEKFLFWWRNALLPYVNGNLIYSERVVDNYPTLQNAEHALYMLEKVKPITYEVIKTYN